MTETDPLWIVIGLTAQVAFSARFLIQWLLSERARRSLLPVHFWTFSVVGAVLLLAYAAHQRDPVIALGQVVGLAIYLRNIELVQRAARGHAWPFYLGWLLLATLALGAGLLSHAGPISAAATRSAPVWMLLGFVGQVLFTGRFVVQLYFSERAHVSVNPVHFWYLSISGSLLLLAYALSTGDFVIILGQSFGLVVYLRNLALIRKHKAPDRHGEGTPELHPHESSVATANPLEPDLAEQRAAIAQATETALAPRSN
jgi:lipid-A-disaccharide synthase-like uncharacterized protein